MELPVFLTAGKQRRQADIGGRGTVVLQPVRGRQQIDFLISVESRSHCYIQQGVFRTDTFDIEGFVEAVPQAL